MPRPNLCARRSNLHDIESALCHLHPPPLALHWMHAAHSSPNTHLTCDLRLRLRVCPSMSSMLYTVVSLASTQAYEHPCYASSSRRALLSHERSYIPAHQLSALSYRPAPGYARHRSTPRLICKPYNHKCLQAQIRPAHRLSEATHAACLANHN